MSEPADRLNNVFWIGGAPCAGKSSISEILAARFDLAVYHVDEAFETHTRGISSARQPNLTKWLESSWDKRWTQPIDRLVEDVTSCYREHFDLIQQDILARLNSRALLVEGTALLPEAVTKILPNKTKAIWLIPTPDFQKEHYSKRVWVRGILAQCENPEVAFHNWMERDSRFAAWIEAEVKRLGLRLLKIDGSRTMTENAGEVARHFQLGGS
jgi:2-phosphoglycerate kinase